MRLERRGRRCERRGCPTSRTCPRSCTSRAQLDSPFRMRPIRRSDSATVALAAATLVALPCLTSCTGKDITNPGESLGTFAVDAHRLTATCGEAQTPPDPWRFDVKLSQ